MPDNNLNVSQAIDECWFSVFMENLGGSCMVILLLVGFNIFLSIFEETEHSLNKTVNESIKKNVNDGNSSITLEQALTEFSELNSPESTLIIFFIALSMLCLFLLSFYFFKKRAEVIGLKKKLKE